MTPARDRALPISVLIPKATDIGLLSGPTVVRYCSFGSGRSKKLLFSACYTSLRIASYAGSISRAVRPSGRWGEGIEVNKRSGRDFTGCVMSTEVAMSTGEEGPLPNLPQDGTAYRQKYWGMGLAVLGFILEWMVTNLVHGSTIIALGLIVAVGICASGIGYYSKAKGTPATWGVVGLVPFLGFLLFLFLFPLVTDIRKNWAGFVLSIVGLGMLVAILIPNYMNYGRASIQTEAKFNLYGILANAISYKTEHRTLEISDINQLGFAPTGKPFYTFWYAVKGVPTKMNVVDPDRARGCDGPPAIAKVAASATGFTAVARGNMDGDSTCDEWSINDARVLTHTINDVGN